VSSRCLSEVSTLDRGGVNRRAEYNQDVLNVAELLERRMEKSLQDRLGSKYKKPLVPEDYLSCELPPNIQPFDLGTYISNVHFWKVGKR
jgi:hypothetical protein